MDCARCGRKFFLHSPINALWCDQDHMFLCRRCVISGGRHRPPRCPQCNHAVSSSVPVVMVLALMGIVLALILAPISYYEATSRQALADTPRAEITNLTAGETVMIYGNIATSAPNPTLSAHWVQAGKSGYWSWTDYAFLLYQGSNSISVSVGGLGDNVYGAPYETNTNEWYDPSDAIAVIGTVYGANGSWAIAAQDAAPSPGGFADPLSVGLWEFSAGLAGFCAVLVAVGWVIGIRRVRAHEARERQPGMYDYRPPVVPPSAPPLLP